jgi:hypothetical protein
MIRTSVRLLACSVTLLLTACFTFTTGVDEPDLASESARVASQIHVGQATRQEVRRLLGTPIFEDPSWGIELYRSRQTDTSTEWLAAPLPFPSWVNVIEYRLYPIIVYSSSDVVEGFGAGRYWEDNVEIGTNRPRGMGADVLGFTLAIDSCDEPWCLWLLAPADRSVPSLRAPPAPGRCVINIPSPDQGIKIALDDRTLLRRKVPGYQCCDYMAAGHWFARVTVSPGKHEVRATPTRWLDRSPGKHKVLATPSGWPDGVDSLVQTIDCRGDQWFVVSIAREIQVLDSPGAIPDDARLILFHNDRALTAAH